MELAQGLALISMQFATIICARFVSVLVASVQLSRCVDLSIRGDVQRVKEVIEHFPILKIRVVVCLFGVGGALSHSYDVRYW